ncbi:F-box/LRR-repeat protein At4g14103-like isoform X2 [Rhododendron vialii]|nr:F-box/LRR-repeat protein At4g14103-like isoform X2 [Rhododendron vialii]XP_058179364.1 F-box/LRR-repeat protein At4g14103-like isoform X2 [Rhododendron vialii]XP_058179372.1 F-box/LRR-repeat protein At4g14103-like isoform X2 [Rhododendron vialii]XP_058179379.1 F-box/LRR-repeat protein At4g14103-like isoform X2 [Rhododendron vialii]XP_058179386.1 F-box/LRR-repeat protein At4g14103-like isoform X2 [Rhododendron vialii]XP_058179395.1 F-box/LRR-repeat protein At4g14103-like isoform X2 [Rhododen
MGSLSKMQKLSEEQYIDRISNLPNSLVTQILSCLPTKYAVATSALSTRWKKLWTSITSLDFDDELLVHPQNQSGNPAVQRSFTSFVCQVFMLHRDSAVQRFRLKLNHIYDISRVNGWIGDMLLRNVQEIDLSIRKEDSTLLPLDLFTCRTLAVLKLAIDCDMNVPTSVSLPNLKILHFVCITFVDDDSINRFLFGCPVLEELNMTACVGEGVKVINIVAPMLTSLNMLNVVSRHYMKPNHFFEGRIVLDTPALLYLTIFDSCADGFELGSLPHLIKADITIIADDYSDPIISEAITDLLKGVSNVRFLHLADFSLESIDRCNSQVPKFPYLTDLALGERPFGIGWKSLPKLLENSPLLESLVFKEGIRDRDYGSPLHWNPPQNVPSCLLSHLKEIEIRFFGGEKEEWEMVEYFLNNAKVLEKVNMHYAGSEREWTIQIR